MSPRPPPASLPFPLYNYPLRSVLVSHPLWGGETEAQGGCGAVHRHTAGQSSSTGSSDSAS